MNFIGHGFQWMYGKDVKEREMKNFIVSDDMAIKMYISDGKFYNANSTPSIIKEDKVESKMLYEKGKKCPELLLIKHLYAWNDALIDNLYKYDKDHYIYEGLRIRELIDNDTENKSTKRTELVVSPECDDTIFKLSTLVDIICRWIKKENAHDSPENSISFRWLVCRQYIITNTDNKEDEILEGLQKITEQKFKHVK